MGKYDDIILFSDLDGTLFDSDTKVSESNKEAIAYFVSEGGRFGVATGRGIENAQAYLTGVQLNYYSIYYNGCILKDCRSGQLVITSYLNKERVLPLIKKCITEKPYIGIQIYGLEKCFIVSGKGSVPQWVLELHHPYEFVSLDGIINLEWIKVLFCANEKQKQWLEHESKELQSEGVVRGVRSGKDFFELLPEKASKGKLITTVKEYIENKAVIYAIGDYYNDLEMIQSATVGVVPFNAPPELREIADIVVTDNNHDAIADLIYNKMLFNKKS